MVEQDEVTSTVEDRAPAVSEAGQELARSLWRLGLAITSSPLRLLPEETRHHLRAAGREAVRAGIALNRGALSMSEKAVSKAHARLDELEERIGADE